MKPHPKPQRYKNEHYLEFIRGKLCGVAGCYKNGEPHHVRRIFWGAGTGQKSHDYVTLSRCRDHHKAEYDDFKEIIQNLKEYIESKENVDVDRMIIDFLIEYIETRGK